MKPFAIGLVLAAAILAAGFLAPALLPSATGPTTLKALADAELARRQLHAYDASLPLVGVRSDVEQLKEADFENLAAQAQEEFEALRSESAQRVNQAKQADRRNDMPESELRPLSSGASGVQASVISFEKLLRENQRLLDEAKRNARAAGQGDRDAIGVGQIAGAVKLAEAGSLLAEARHLRAELTAVQTRAFAAASEWVAVRAEKDYYAGLEVSSIRDELHADAEEIEAALAESQAEYDRLAMAVAESERRLADLRVQLEQARIERLGLEEMGFIIGDDASFEAYRQKYLELSECLRELQSQEQLVAFGGIPGDDDLAAGKLHGDVVYGLNELRSRLAIAKDKLERYVAARQALAHQTRLVDALGEQTQAQAGQRAALLETIAARVNGLLGAMADLAQQAFDKEEAALGAAREAATAFKNANSAVGRWIDDANTLQRAKDPQRINERLKLITGDSFAAGFAGNAEAQAKMLAGRIHTERALGLAAQLDTFRRIAELVPGSEPETAELQDSFNTARDAAVSVLNEARAAYERLAQKQTSVSWVHQASLATVYHLLWQIDEFNAAQHRSNLIDQLDNVVTDRQQSPHLQQQVALHAVVTADAGPARSSRPDEDTGNEGPGDVDAGE